MLSNYTLHKVASGEPQTRPGSYHSGSSIGKVQRGEEKSDQTVRCITPLENRSAITLPAVLLRARAEAARYPRSGLENAPCKRKAAGGDTMKEPPPLTVYAVRTEGEHCLVLRLLLPLSLPPILPASLPPIQSDRHKNKTSPGH
ncbi:hypothetical protein CRENBAI_000377 [Crenichthys baileyi]|uniref:Uncharacterized protein n=1 Tax=Crenichthys baileyi TaxID=28760 RepID=A0AAV9S952_9TELE